MKRAQETPDIEKVINSGGCVLTLPPENCPLKNIELPPDSLAPGRVPTTVVDKIIEYGGCVLIGQKPEKPPYQDLYVTNPKQKETQKDPSPAETPPDHGFICYYNPQEIWGNESVDELEKIAMTTPTQQTLTDQVDAIPISQAQKKGQIKVGIDGDPNNTLEENLTITNLTSQDLCIEIEDWIFFNPTNSRTLSAAWKNT